MIRVEGQKNLYRDNSGAIVNTDTDQYNQYVRLREKRKLEKKEIVEIKQEIEELKSLLKEVLKNGS
jgi:hypothetical protein|tara:strand:+ start:156 stop:353 length:198 start_codon:yes stop_codon:yes gene_type:complete